MTGARNEVRDIGGVRYIDAQIAGVAARQHGVVARSQLAALGVGEDAIEHRLAAQRLHRLHRGVYAVGHRVLSREGVWLAAVLACGAGSVLCDRSAAALWNIRPPAGSLVDVAAAARRRSRPGIAVHSRRVVADEVTTYHRIPVTTPARTLFDLAAALTRQELERAVDRAEVRGLASPTSLAALVARYPRRPGTANLNALLAAGRIGAMPTRSDLEDRLLALLDAHGLPRPDRTNASVDVRGYKRIEPDAMWRDARVLVELDGYETHGTRQAFEDDRARDAALQAEGWRTLRFTWRQLVDDGTTIARRLSALI